MRESSSTKTSYSTKKLTVPAPGTATVIFEKKAASSCQYRVRTALQNSRVKNLTFLNLALREDMLEELRLKMSGLLNVDGDIGEEDLPLACDYFFFVSSQDFDDEIFVDVQFVNARTGVVDWSAHLENPSCEGVVSQLTKILR